MRIQELYQTAVLVNGDAKEVKTVDVILLGCQERKDLNGKQRLSRQHQLAKSLT